jgi:hypothetical protein
MLWLGLNSLNPRPLTLQRQNDKNIYIIEFDLTLRIILSYFLFQKARSFNINSNLSQPYSGKISKLYSILSFVVNLLDSLIISVVFFISVFRSSRTVWAKSRTIPIFLSSSCLHPNREYTKLFLKMGRKSFLWKCWNVTWNFDMRW